jgi:hypothetical protein
MLDYLVAYFWPKYLNFRKKIRKYMRRLHNSHRPTNFQMRIEIDESTAENFDRWNLDRNNDNGCEGE